MIGKKMRRYRLALLGVLVALCLCAPLHVAEAAPPSIPPGTTFEDLFPDDVFALSVAQACGKTSITEEATQGDLDTVTSLNVSNKGISDLTGISYLQNLIGFNASKNTGITVPAEIGNLTVLREIDLSYNPGIVVPSALGDIATLEQLNLSHNPGIAIPEEIYDLSALTTLYLNDNGLSSISDNIGKLSNLQKLFLTNNMLQTLPTSIGSLTAMTELYVGNNQLVDVPDEITNLTDLTTLNIGTNRLTHIPEPMLNLVNLDSLYIDNNELNGAVPDSIDQLTNLKLLYIYSNHITSIPDSLGNMTGLERFACDDNELAYIPQNLEDLPNLVLLHIGENQVVSTLPAMDSSVDYNNKTMIATLAKKITPAGGPLSYSDIVPDAMIWARTQNGDTFSGLGTWTLTKPDASTIMIPAGDGSEINGSLFTSSGDYTLIFTFENSNGALLAGSVYTMPVEVGKATVAASDLALLVGETKQIPNLVYSPLNASIVGSIADTSIATIEGTKVTGVNVGITQLSLQAEDQYGNLSDPVIVQVTVTAPTPTPTPTPTPAPIPTPTPEPSTASPLALKALPKVGDSTDIVMFVAVTFGMLALVLLFARVFLRYRRHK